MSIPLMLKFKVLSITLQRLLFIKSEQALAPQEKNAEVCPASPPGCFPPRAPLPPRLAANSEGVRGGPGSSSSLRKAAPPSPPAPPPDPAPTRFAGPWLSGAGWAGKPLVGAPLDSELGAHRLYPRGDRAPGTRILR